jgi:hypothetical protein
VVNGNAGAYLGFGMSAGRIRVAGNAGIFAGCEMEGGTIEIGGNAGDWLGAALAGDKQGMRGGLIHVRGKAGDRAADRMRRGVILIEGGAGAYLGSQACAGWHWDRQSVRTRGPQPAWRLHGLGRFCFDGSTEPPPPTTTAVSMSRFVPGTLSDDLRVRGDLRVPVPPPRTG